MLTECGLRKGMVDAGGLQFGRISAYYWLKNGLAWLLHYFYCPHHGPKYFAEVV